MNDSTPAGDIEAMTARTGWLSDERKIDTLIRFAPLCGSAPDLAFDRAQPRLAEGQIWALTENAGLPNHLIYLHAVTDSQLSVYGVSDKESFACPKDFIVDDLSSPLEFGLMVETWNSFLISPKILDHCVGSLMLDQILSIRNLPTIEVDNADASHPRPIRWPGDPRIEFQSSERRRYRLARQLSKFNADRMILSVTVGIPTVKPISTPAAEESPEILCMAAKTGMAGRATLKIYRPVLENRTLRMALVIWADGSIGMTADTSDPEFAAEFSTQDGILIPVETFSSDQPFRIWKVASAESVRQNGVEGVFRLASGLVAVSLRPGLDFGADPTIKKFRDYVQRFEAGGSCFREILTTVSHCKDRILRYLLEEDVKTVVRLDKHHPSWPHVYSLIRATGSPNLYQWANKRNG